MPACSGSSPPPKVAMRCGPLVHGEEAADSMAGAMGIIEALSPEILPGEYVELAAARAQRKARRAQSDMALEHQREPLTHLGARHADGDGAGDVGGAVLVLTA